MAKRENFVSLTDQDIQKLKEMIRTGEPIYRIATRMAPMYNRPVVSFYHTLLNISKRTYKIAEWTGSKRRRTRNTQLVAVETAPSSTSTTARVEKYDDHIRIYF